jgi:hypothetical protein
MRQSKDCQAKPGGQMRSQAKLDEFVKSLFLLSWWEGIEGTGKLTIEKC